MAKSRAERDAMEPTTELPEMPEGYFKTYTPGVPIDSPEVLEDEEQTQGLLPGQQGNKAWMYRSSHGVNPRFEHASDLLDACIQYFNFCEENPLYEVKMISYEGISKLVPVPKMRAPTIQGMMSFIGMSSNRWRHWRSSRPDLKAVVQYVDNLIYQRKFEGATAGLLNASIIIRDLGLADKQEHSGPGGEPLKTISTTMTPEEAAQAYADTIADT